MLEQTGVWQRPACLPVGLSRAVLHYAPKVWRENAQLQRRMVELASERRRFGYRRIHALLRREGMQVNSPKGNAVCYGYPCKISAYLADQWDRANGQKYSESSFLKKSNRRNPNIAAITNRSVGQDL
jgi:hypothetical protein